MNFPKLMTFAAVFSVLFSGASQAGGDYVDVHMHLHPRGLDAAMGNRAQGGSTMQPGRGVIGRQGGGFPGPRQGMQRQGMQRQGMAGRGLVPGGGRGQQRMGMPGPSGGGGPQGGAAVALARAADALVAMMDARGLKTALVVTVPSHKLSPEQDYQLIRDAVARHPKRLRQLAGGATLKAMPQDIPADRVTEADRTEFRNRAEHLIDAGAAGFGEMISLHLCMTERHNYQFAPADHPLFKELADIAAGRDVAIDLHMESVLARRPMLSNLKGACSKNPDWLEASVPRLERLLAHNRRARIVWQHIGWDNTGGMDPGLFQRLLRDHPNLYLALRVEKRINQVGGGGPMPNRIVDGAGRITSEWLALIEAHPERFVLGADEFVGPSGSPSMAASFQGTWSLVDQLPAALAARVGGANARRIYNLD